MKYFKLNQTVYHPIYGEGKVIDINLSMNYPILVRFQEDNYTFTIDGKNDVTSFKIALSQNPIPEIVNKPLEDTYIPFTFEDDLLGKHIKNKKGDRKGIITHQNKSGIYPGDLFVPYEHLLTYWEFADGKPCGKLAN